MFLRSFVTLAGLCCSALLNAAPLHAYSELFQQFAPRIAFSSKNDIAVETAPDVFFVMGSSNASLNFALRRLGCETLMCSVEPAGEVWTIQRHAAATSQESSSGSVSLHAQSNSRAEFAPKVHYNEPSFIVMETTPEFFYVLASERKAFEAARKRLGCGSSGICSESRNGPAWTIQRSRAVRR